MMIAALLLKQDHILGQGDEKLAKKSENHFLSALRSHHSKPQQMGHFMSSDRKINHIHWTPRKVFEAATISSQIQSRRQNLNALFRSQSIDSNYSDSRERAGRAKPFSSPEVQERSMLVLYRFGIAPPRTSALYVDLYPKYERVPLPYFLCFTPQITNFR
jgi:hypothetical protein